MKPLSSQIQEYLVDAASMLLGLITTFLALYLQTPLSNLASTSYEYLYIMMAASTSLSLFHIPKWRLPAILILLLAAFPVDKYLLFHYLWAILFFVTAYYKIFQAKRFSIFFFLLIPASLLFGYYNYMIMDYNLGLLAFEAISIPAIIAHHTCYLFYRIRLSSPSSKANPTNKRS
jgi:hypothetical protein